MRVMTSRTSKAVRRSLGMRPSRSSAALSGSAHSASRGNRGARVQVRAMFGQDVPRDAQGVLIVLGQVVRHAGLARMHVAAAQILRGHVLARGSLDQRRPGQEDGPLVPHDHGLVAHGRDVGPARRAAAHHHGDLRDALGAHAGLVEEDAAEMVLVGIDLRLQGQEGAAAVHQVDAGQMVLFRHFLGAQVFFHRHGKIAAALDGGVVGHDHAMQAGDLADAGDDAGARARRCRTCPRRPGGKVPGIPRHRPGAWRCDPGPPACPGPRAFAPLRVRRRPYPRACVRATDPTDPRSAERSRGTSRPFLAPRTMSGICRMLAPC